MTLSPRTREPANPRTGATRNPPGIGTLRTATPDQRDRRRSLSDVRKSLCLVVEPDNVHHLAITDGQHLKPKDCSTTLPGILCTSHTHTDEKSITEDLHVIHALPDASISTRWRFGEAPLSPAARRWFKGCAVAGAATEAGHPPGGRSDRAGRRGQDR